MKWQDEFDRVTLDRNALCRALERESEDPAFCTVFIQTKPHLFSNVPVFRLSEAIVQMDRMVAAPRGGGTTACLSRYGSLMGAPATNSAKTVRILSVCQV